MPNMDLPPPNTDVVIFEKARQKDEKTIHFAQLQSRPHLTQQEIQDIESTKVTISGICAMLALGLLVMKILQNHKSGHFHKASDNILYTGGSWTLWWCTCTSSPGHFTCPSQMGQHVDDIWQCSGRTIEDNKILASWPETDEGAGFQSVTTIYGKL